MQINEFQVTNALQSLEEQSGNTVAVLSGLTQVVNELDDYQWCLEVEGSDVGITSLEKPIRLFVNGDVQFWLVDAVVIQVPTNTPTSIVFLQQEEE